LTWRSPLPADGNWRLTGIRADRIVSWQVGDEVRLMDCGWRHVNATSAFVVGTRAAIGFGQCFPVSGGDVAPIGINRPRPLCRVFSAQTPSGHPDWMSVVRARSMWRSPRFQLVSSFERRLMVTSIPLELIVNEAADKTRDARKPTAHSAQIEECCHE
jgi:hypothetical protein